MSDDRHEDDAASSAQQRLSSEQGQQQQPQCVVCTDHDVAECGVHGFSAGVLRERLLHVNLTHHLLKQI